MPSCWPPGRPAWRTASAAPGLPVTICGTDIAVVTENPDSRAISGSACATLAANTSFYQPDAEGNRQRAHFDGLPVGFVAEAIATLGARVVDGFETYHVMNPHDDGIRVAEYVDWLIEAGYPIQRIADFGEWVQRFAVQVFQGNKAETATMLPAITSFMPATNRPTRLWSRTLA